MTRCPISNKASCSFDKFDIFRALLERNLEGDYFNLLKMEKDTLLSVKSLPKPFDDINDCVLMSLM
jgi:hypothetical protein